MNSKLSLYHLPYCGFCHKVRRAAARLGIELELRDITNDSEARELLLENLGRTTVPVLRIDSASDVTLMPESDDIIEYLEVRAFGQALAA
jgi:glutaredoxin